MSPVHGSAPLCMQNAAAVERATVKCTAGRVAGRNESFRMTECTAGRSVKAILAA